MPKGRTVKYLLWRFCERFSIKPPGVKENIDDNVAWQTAQILAYENIRQNEDSHDC